MIARIRDCLHEDRAQAPSQAQIPGLRSACRPNVQSGKHRGWQTLESLRLAFVLQQDQALAQGAPASPAAHLQPLQDRDREVFDN
ncbi:MAG: hypothetical protein EBX68_06875, partial [Betaproteobacteria bacterium]|nr:hypothetical protein [Betaproteobacteria bacterium]